MSKKETTYLNVIVYNGTIRKEVPKESTAEREVKRIMKEGIFINIDPTISKYSEIKKEYYPPHSIWHIKITREDA